MKVVVGGTTTTTYIKYYMAGTTRIAMHKYTIPQPMMVEYMLSDHLGSTSLTADADGNKVLEIRYKAWCEIRATWTNVPVNIDPAYKMPLYTYTGQASYMDDPTTSGVTEGFGLMFYQSRFYDPQLGRFTQADTIIPESTQGTQAWDRYAGMNNNPVRYNDPTGHCTGSGFWNAMGCIASAIGSTVSYIVEHPNEVLIKGKSFVVPVVLPKGFGRETMDIVNTTISFKTVRTVGRLGDDAIIPAFIAGYIATIGPEQSEDLAKGASFSEHLADGIIDTGGFLLSEIVGDVFGAASASFIGPGSILVMVASDAMVGNIYDNSVTDEDREFLQALIEATQIEPQDSHRVVPNPTPRPNPIGTPDR